MKKRGKLTGKEGNDAMNGQTARLKATNPGDSIGKESRARCPVLDVHVAHRDENDAADHEEADEDENIVDEAR